MVRHVTYNLLDGEATASGYTPWAPPDSDGDFELLRSARISMKNITGHSTRFVEVEVNGRKVRVELFVRQYFVKPLGNPIIGVQHVVSSRGRLVVNGWLIYHGCSVDVGNINVNGRPYLSPATGKVNESVVECATPRKLADLETVMLACVKASRRLQLSISGL